MEPSGKDILSFTLRIDSRTAMLGAAEFGKILWVAGLAYYQHLAHTAARLAALAFLASFGNYCLLMAQGKTFIFEVM
jgi:hypothetical protein